MVGNYQVEGSYAREFAIYDDPLVISDNMDRRQFNLQFSIYVEGILKNNHIAYRNYKNNLFKHISCELHNNQ